MPKPILCLDFDGVIHSYTSGWEGAHVVSDPPVPGAMEFIEKAVKSFDVAIFSSRTHQEGGLDIMKEYLRYHLEYELGVRGLDVYSLLLWPLVKPAAFLTLDDRAMTFTGVWPDVRELFNFRVWYKKKD